jgi:hypothetical protein
MAAGALGNIAGGLIGGNAAGSAGAQAYNNANALATTDRNLESPYVDTGASATSALSALAGNGKLTWDGSRYNGNQANWQQDQKDAAAKFQTSPGYTFQVQQGVNALDRSAASRGMVNSGAQQQAITNYGQQEGNTAYQNWLNQLEFLASNGQAGTNAAVSGGNQAMIPGINAMAQGSAAQGASVGNGIAGGLNSLAALGAFGLGGGFGSSGQAGGYTVAQAPMGGYTANYLAGVPGGMPSGWA